MWSTFLRTETWSTMFRKFEVGAWLSAGGNFHSYWAVHCIYVDFGTKHSISHGNSKFGENQIAFARECLVWSNTNLDVQIAFFAPFWRRATFAG